MAKVKLFAKERNKFKKEILSQMREDSYLRPLREEVESFVQEQYEETTKHWKGRHDAQSIAPEGVSIKGKEWERPTPKINVKSTVLSNGTIKIKVESDVEGDLWHWLDDGTDSYTHQTKSAMFPPRTQNRTVPGDVYVKQEARFGRPVVIPAGKTRKGIKGRNWSDAIGKNVQEKLVSKSAKLNRIGRWHITHQLKKKK